jgi:hypothetical protein
MRQGVEIISGLPRREQENGSVLNVETFASCAIASSTIDMKSHQFATNRHMNRKNLGVMG